MMKPKKLDTLKKIAINALEELKGVDIIVMDVHRMTTVTDLMIICSGTSSRHVKSLAENLVMHVKKQGIRPLGVEGESEGEWVLVDLNDMIVHIMLPRTREFYNLENLWNLPRATGKK